MPLIYDNIPGSWGIYSEKWPKLLFTEKDQIKRAFIACTKALIVPYGSYVEVDLELRIETEKLKTKLENYLNASPYKTYETLKYYFISTGVWK